MALWGPVFLYAGFLFWLSSLSHPSVPRFPYADKIYHALLYAAFGLLLLRALEPARRRWGKTAVVACSVLGTVAYGLTDEFHQLFVEARSADFADLVADAAGGLIGAVLFFAFRYYADKILRRRKISRDPQTLASL